MEKNYLNPHLSEQMIQSISSAGLAHVGDAVFELLVRTWLCEHGKATGQRLHQAAIRIVCAPSQAERVRKIDSFFTEEERAVFRRGRNSHPRTIPEHATRAQYHEATALEALFGWLYLSGQTARINELFLLMMDEPDNPVTTSP